jgi:hypothetical protein
VAFSLSFLAKVRKQNQDGVPDLVFEPGVVEDSQQMLGNPPLGRRRISGDAPLAARLTAAILFIFSGLCRALLSRP